MKELDALVQSGLIRSYKTEQTWTKTYYGPRRDGDEVIIEFPNGQTMRIASCTHRHGYSFLSARVGQTKETPDGNGVP